MESHASFRRTANKLLDWGCLTSARLHTPRYPFSDRRGSDFVTYELTYPKGKLAGNTAGKITVKHGTNPTVTLSESYIPGGRGAIPLTEVLTVDEQGNMSTSFRIPNALARGGFEEVEADGPGALEPLWRRMRLRPSDFFDHNGLPDKKAILDTAVTLATAYAHRKHIEPLFQKMHLLDVPAQSLAEQERDILRSARTELRGYGLAIDLHRDRPRVDYILFDPEGNETSSLTINSSPVPHTTIFAPFIADGTMREGLTIRRNGEKASFLKSFTEYDVPVSCGIENEKALLNTIWNHLPGLLREIPYLHERSDQHDIYKALCFVTDAYRQIVSLEERTRPEADMSRLTRRMSQESTLKPTGAH